MAAFDWDKLTDSFGLTPNGDTANCGPGGTSRCGPAAIPAPPSGPPVGAYSSSRSCFDPSFSGPGHISKLGGQQTGAQQLLELGCKYAGIDATGIRNFCCPPPGTCPVGTRKEVTYSGPKGDDAQRYAELGISVHSYPIIKCVPIPGYVPPATVGPVVNGNGQPVVNGNGQPVAEERPFYLHPLFLVGVGGLVVYLILR